MCPISDRDLELARSLPDDLVAGGGGSAAHRLIEIVGENWVRFGILQRAELVDGLLPILEGLLHSGGGVTDAHRDACQATVTKWIEWCEQREPGA